MLIGPHLHIKTLKVTKNQEIKNIPCPVDIFKRTPVHTKVTTKLGEDYIYISVPIVILRGKMWHIHLRNAEKQKTSKALQKLSKCSFRCTYASRVVVNTIKDHIGSENWRLDWAKLNNKSYAWVASQKIRQSAVTVRNKNVKNTQTRVNGHIHDSSVKYHAKTVDRNSETQASQSVPKTTHVNKGLLKVSTDNVISTRNRFDVLNSIDNNTDCGLQYTGNVKCVQFEGVTSECKQSNLNVNNDNVAVVHKDASFDSLVLKKQSNKQQGNTSTSKNLTTLSKSAVSSSCAGESNVLQTFSPNDKRRRHLSVSGVTDKYDLELRFRPRHRDQIASAKENYTFTRWNSQTQEKFGFIPFGDLTLPPIDLQKQSKEHIFDIHRRVKVSGTHNYMKTQVQIQSQLKPDVWHKYLTNYWDSQLVLLLRYGFPLDFNYSTPLNSVESNHSSANQYWQDVQAYLDEEKEFGAILGPFQEAPIDNLHVSPFLTRDKPGGAHRRVIVILKECTSWANREECTKRQLQIIIYYEMC